MGFFRFTTRVILLLIAAGCVLQCDFLVFPDYLTRVNYTKNLMGQMPSDDSSFSVAVENINDNEYVVLVQYKPSGARKLFLLDRGLNILLANESAGYGKASGQVTRTAAPVRNAIVCGMVIIDPTDSPTITFTGTPADPSRRDDFLCSDGLDLYYYNNNGAGALSRYHGAATFGSNWTYPALTAMADVSIGSGGRSFALDSMKSFQGNVSAVFREDNGNPCLVYYAAASFTGLTSIPDSALSTMPGSLVAGSSWVFPWNQVLLQMADGDLKRFRNNFGSWVQENGEESGWQFRNNLVGIGSEYMYFFNPQTREIMRVRPEWR